MLLPQYCRLCDARTNTVLSVCAFCLPQLPWLGHSCRGCGLPLSHLNAYHCGHCLKRMPPINLTVCCFQYRGVIQQWIQQYKFHHQLDLHTLFAHCIQQRMAAQHIDADLILAVPIHPRRLKQRGFNQCSLIAQRVSRALGIPFDDNILVRHKHSAAQMTLPAKQRHQNIKGCFTVTRCLHSLRLILLEDVITTGATINEAAMTLKAHGALSVQVWAIARATDQAPPTQPMACYPRLSLGQD